MGVVVYVMLRSNNGCGCVRYGGVAPRNLPMGVACSGYNL